MCADNGLVLQRCCQWLGPALSMSAKSSRLTMQPVVSHRLAGPQPVTITLHLIHPLIKTRKEPHMILHCCTHCQQSLAGAVEVAVLCHAALQLMQQSGYSCLSTQVCRFSHLQRLSSKLFAVIMDNCCAHQTLEYKLMADKPSCIAACCRGANADSPSKGFTGCRPDMWHIAAEQ